MRAIDILARQHKVKLLVHRNNERYWVRANLWSSDCEDAQTFTLHHEASNVARTRAGTVGTLFEARRRKQARLAAAASQQHS